MGVSPLTGKKLSVSTMSGILHTTKHQISPSDFKILSTATSEADLLIRESLFISCKLNPTYRVPTVLENPGKSLNLLKKSKPGKSLETDKVLESPGIFFQ
jgi:hypothetical protein